MNNEQFFLTYFWDWRIFLFENEIEIELKTGHMWQEIEKKNVNERVKKIFKHMDHDVKLEFIQLFQNSTWD